MSEENKPLLTAGGLVARRYSAVMGHTPKPRYIKASEEHPEDYVLDVYFIIRVGIDDVRHSEHFSHCFRPSILRAAFIGEGEKGQGMEGMSLSTHGKKAVKITRDQIKDYGYTQATGDKADINEQCKPYWLRFRGEDDEDWQLLKPKEGVIIRRVFPGGVKKAFETKMAGPHYADILLEARGCDISPWGAYPWPYFDYSIELVHNADADTANSMFGKEAPPDDDEDEGDEGEESE